MASWAFLGGLVLYAGRYGVGPVFWNRPAFLARLSEDFGAIVALLVLALILAEWRRDRPPPVTQLAVSFAVLTGIQWVLGRWPIPALVGKVALLGLLIWILSQVYRGARHLFRSRTAPVSADSTSIQPG